MVYCHYYADYINSSIQEVALTQILGMHENYISHF